MGPCSCKELQALRPGFPIGYTNWMASKLYVHTYMHVGWKHLDKSQICGGFANTTHHLINIKHTTANPGVREDRSVHCTVVMDVVAPHVLFGWLRFPQNALKTTYCRYSAHASRVMFAIPAIDTVTGYLRSLTCTGMPSLGWTSPVPTRYNRCLSTVCEGVAWFPLNPC